MTYEAPKLTELGSVASFTQRDEWALDYDGNIFKGDSDDPQPTS